ncbi:MAG: hypothetical protein DWI68_03825, partial [Chloroflexi bacterium]
MAQGSQRRTLGAVLRRALQPHAAAKAGPAQRAPQTESALFVHMHLHVRGGVQRARVGGIVRAAHAPHGAHQRICKTVVPCIGRGMQHKQAIGMQ